VIGGVSVDARNTIFWQNTNNFPTGEDVYMFGTSGSQALVTVGHVVMTRAAAVFQNGFAQLTVNPLGTLWYMNPNFIDPNGYNFRLKYTSPCRDQGTGTIPGFPLPAEDFEGDPRVEHSAPDIGADEFYTHLYFTGNPAASGFIEVHAIGDPNMAVLLFTDGALNSNGPVMTSAGLYYLTGGAIQVVLPNTDPDGLSSTGPIQLPAAAVNPPPYNLYNQALIGDLVRYLRFTNLCTISVRY
jgi:hypothetical protein